MTTETAVALRPSGRLAIGADQDFWTVEQVAALKVLGIKDATNGDLAVYFHVARRMQLDPFTRQIYMINRRTKERWQDERGQWQEAWVAKQTIQVGIDGFRVVRDRVAERTKCEVEFEDTTWFDADGREQAVWLSADAPAACRVVLVKHSATGRPLRYPAVLRTSSYMQTNAKGEPVSQWKTQPEHMIEKCCEAFATRRAFPNDFSGVYLEEEMAGRADAEQREQAAGRKPVTVAEIMGEPDGAVVAGEVVTDPVPASPAAPTPTPADAKPGSDGQPAPAATIKRLAELIRSLSLGEEADVLELLAWMTGRVITGLPDLSRSEARNVAAILDSHLAAAEGDLTEAASALWTQYHAAQATRDGTDG